MSKNDRVLALNRFASIVPATTRNISKVLIGRLFIISYAISNAATPRLLTIAFESQAYFFPASVPNPIAIDDAPSMTEM
ncbi:hypothetical protein [Nitrososphaera viennensis]|uniref:Uncharacterized protein n=1 Tax=Nitrososphaera viennensis TaxID=1034015 RepID=A0A977NKN2_9ARCH|nr:hypothetical protein [Nitrososphaera viennensis]UVS67894.1 hypothetical protein NWT39_08240 [Nitrososphaera viennensis]